MHLNDRILTCSFKVLSGDFVTLKFVIYITDVAKLLFKGFKRKDKSH